MLVLRKLNFPLPDCNIVLGITNAGRFIAPAEIHVRMYTFDGRPLPSVAFS